MTDKQNFEKDINVPSKRFDYTDKIHTELANYEQMERDIEKIIEPYQTEIEAEVFSLPTAIESILERKEQECENMREAMKKGRCTNYVLGECSQKHHNNCVGENQCIKDLEQECERLKNIINEAKNSKLDLKSFLVGEAVQNEYEQQLDQLKEQLEAYKMEAEEGKEINAELKAENEKLKAKIIEWLDKKGITRSEKEIFDQYKQALKNIIDGRIGNCCCPEEYAMKVISDVEDVGF